MDRKSQMNSNPILAPRNPDCQRPSQKIVSHSQKIGFTSPPQKITPQREAKSSRISSHEDVACHRAVTTDVTRNKEKNEKGGNDEERILGVRSVGLDADGFADRGSAGGESAECG